MTPKQIANFVADAHVCRSCGAVFDATNDPHFDDDCPQKNASWDIPTREQIAAALLDRMEQ